MLKSLMLALALAPIALAGCGGDDSGPGVTGTFKTTGHQFGSTCGAMRPIFGECADCEFDHAYFKVKSQTAFGQTFLTTVACQADGSCADDGDDPNDINIDMSGMMFGERDGDAWTGFRRTSQTQGDRCDYTQTNFRLESTEEGGVVLTMRTYQGEFNPLPAEYACAEGENWFDDDCGCMAYLDTQPSLAAAECVDEERVEGTPKAEADAAK